MAKMDNIKVHVYHHIIQESEDDGSWVKEALLVLGTIDAKQLEQAALNQEQWGEDRTHTEIVLDLITEVFHAIESERATPVRRGGDD